ncbi:tRNA-binding protein [Candidatus Peribacteria bacterium]|nr:tRNA-binding protein [Candidatus Peribacteria bacterium]MBM3301448.1 tRNA-binding protein [Deltaproteobacteria bacterium]
MATIEDFQKLDIRVGRVLSCDAFPEAHKPAYKLMIDFGAKIGTKRSSVQITENYRMEDLVGSLVLGVVNFPPRQIGTFLSEVLTLGVPDAQGRVILIRPTGDVPIGGRLY